MDSALDYAIYFANRYHMIMIIVLIAANDYRAIPEECNDLGYPVIDKILPKD